jgi:hypothetical protein
MAVKHVCDHCGNDIGLSIEAVQIVSITGGSRFSVFHQRDYPVPDGEFCSWNCAVKRLMECNASMTEMNLELEK